MSSILLTGLHQKQILELNKQINTSTTHSSTYTQNVKQFQLKKEEERRAVDFHRIIPHIKNL